MDQPVMKSLVIPMLDVKALLFPVMTITSAPLMTVMMLKDVYMNPLTAVMEMLVRLKVVIQ